MNGLASPLGILRQMAQGGLGRGILFWMACGLGRAISVIMARAWEVMMGSTSGLGHDLFEELGRAMLVVPMRMVPELWEFFAFLRFELSLRWLAAPFLILLLAPFFEGVLNSGC